MRVVIGATLVALTGLMFHSMGCAGGVDTGTTGSGSGGAGGEACVPTDEVCGNGLDDDCDGQVDETCDCQPDDMQPCYSGPAGTEDVGICTAGTQACDPATHTWGACTGDVIPASSEDCNNEDDDCDGEIDQGIAPILCGVGACVAMVEGCVAGVVPTCVPGQPSIEVCDGLDNDCDQLTDESFPNSGLACDSGIPGACAAGTFQCLAGVETCVQNLMPTNETCDSIDNDCDGTVDNNIPGTGGNCSTGFPGVCSAGTISCQNGSIDCYSITPSSTEICDGLDNDCDGQTDENNPDGGGACTTGQLGVCSAGTQICTNGSLVCTPNNLGSAESCNGLDDNCDGQADEGNPGGGGACGCGGTFQCQNGALACIGGPVTYFQETFANNNAGWTLGPTWQIGAAVGGCAGCTGNPDPATDHTATADNGLAGVVIGGPTGTALHDFYWLESPPFDTSNAVGSVYLQFWRWLNSDYLSFMQNAVQVWNGSAWIDLPYGLTGNCCPGVQDNVWTNHGVPVGAPLQATNSAQYPTQFDLTPYKNAQMRVRFGYKIGSSGVYTIGGWSVDDVLVASAICP